METKKEKLPHFLFLGYIMYGERNAKVKGSVSIKMSRIFNRYHKTKFPLYINTRNTMTSWTENFLLKYCFHCNIDIFWANPSASCEILNILELSTAFSDFLNRNHQSIFHTILLGNSFHFICQFGKFQY